MRRLQLWEINELVTLANEQTAKQQPKRGGRAEMAAHAAALAARKEGA